MFEFGGTITEGLARTGPEELTASSVRLAQRKIERAVIQVLDRGLSESEVVPVSGQRTGGVCVCGVDGEDSVVGGAGEVSFVGGKGLGRRRDDPEQRRAGGAATRQLPGTLPYL